MSLGARFSVDVLSLCCASLFRASIARCSAMSAKDNSHPLVVAGPTAVGKSSLLDRLLKDHPDVFARAVSHTTRASRQGEQDGVNYHFVPREKFQELVAQDAFVEHTERNGNLYGASKAALQDISSKGKICILDIDMQGVKSVKATSLNVHCLFIKPPSVEVLEKRLRDHKSESEEAIQARLTNAKLELEFAETGVYDHTIVNVDLETAYNQLKAWVDDHYQIAPATHAAEMLEVKVAIMTLTDAEQAKRLLVVSGPSGSGKSTVLNRLLKDYSNLFGFSVSHTTRGPREGEKDGVNYHFVTREKFDSLIADHVFVEHAEFSGNLYGTSKVAIEAVTEKNKICVLDIDMQGVKSVKAASIDACYIFVKPPNIEELENRLRSRNTESEEAVQKRLSAAKAELDYAGIVGVHDFTLINDEVNKAYESLKSWIFEKYKMSKVTDSTTPSTTTTTTATSDKKETDKNKSDCDKKSTKNGSGDKKKSKFCIVS